MNWGSRNIVKMVLENDPMFTEFNNKLSSLDKQIAKGSNPHRANLSYDDAVDAFEYLATKYDVGKLQTQLDSAENNLSSFWRKQA